MDVLVNGLAQTTVGYRDRGLQYGDGLFETILILDGQPCLWHRHWRRLTHGCKRLGIPLLAEPLLRQEVEQLARGRTHAILKLIVTRGEGPRGYRPPDNQQPSRILSVSDWQAPPEELYRDGARLIVCNTRLGLQPALAGIKHLNRLEQVLARAEWSDPSVHDGLMLDQEDRVIETVNANILWRSGRRWHTPSLQRCGVAGVVRDLLLDLAGGAGEDIAVADYALEDLLTADAVYQTNSLIGIVPIVRIGDRVWDSSSWSHPLVSLLAQQVHRVGA